MRFSRLWIRFSRVWMRFSQVWLRLSWMVRVSDWRDCHQCYCHNCYRIDPSIHQHRGTWGAADEAALNKVLKKWIPFQSISYRLLWKGDVPFGTKYHEELFLFSQILHTEVLTKPTYQAVKPPQTAAIKPLRYIQLGNPLSFASIPEGGRIMNFDHLAKRTKSPFPGNVFYSLLEGREERTPIRDYVLQSNRLE
jgi:hypothetical protein